MFKNVFYIGLLEGRSIDLGFEQKGIMTLKVGNRSSGVQRKEREMEVRERR